MRKSIGRGPAVALAVAACAAGASGMALLEPRLAPQDLSPVTLAHELEVAGLCANGLALNRSGDRDRLALLLAQRMDSAIDRASTLTNQGVGASVVGPHLRDSVRRAADYYRVSGDGDRRRRAEALIAAPSGAD